MNYELAKQLKDAGFPQRGLVTSEDMAINPTLSELIEACISSTKTFELRYHISTEDWHCNLGVWNESHGTTPEEAVAKLWLELTKK